MRSPSTWGPSVPTRSSNRPDTCDRIPKHVMFHHVGPSGWGQIRQLGGYKQGRSEHDFHDQHRRFFDPAADTLE